MENRLIYTVTELTAQIKDSLETLFPNIWVEGEVSNLRIPSSGHYYFTLKDPQCQMRAVMFRSQQRSLQFALEDGMAVACRGRVNVYEPRGEYQLLIETLEPKGKGALQVAFEQLKKKLQEEGLFDAARKKPLPLLPARIALITSPTGAAVRDILNILNRRFPNLEILIVPVKVQGEEAPGEIIRALQLVNAEQAADVIIVTRGGGSLEDLWAFNTEQMARAIYNSRIPVVSAVGHEIDFTIADFVADLRAPTPSAAAELVVKDKKDLLQLLSHCYIRLRKSLSHCVQQEKARISYLALRLQDPGKRLVQHRIQCDDLHARLVRTMLNRYRENRALVRHRHDTILLRAPQRLLEHNRSTLRFLEKTLKQLPLALAEQCGSRLKSAVEKLNVLSPLNILERGYSITRLAASGAIVKSARQLHAGDSLDIKLKDGEAYCIVDKVVL
ncbi:MAG: exodeoxyribonuclease VII large subunit [Proteobacteria bacterium]|nr:exodeoxyribonuclease VII large subunit [Pseudomonadota bacterium]